MADTAYSGQLGYPFSSLFTPLTGTPFGTAQAQVEEAEPPETTLNTPKFTPISGPNAGVEQFVVANSPVKEYKMMWTYTKAAYQAALVCKNAKITGTLANTYADGSVESWVGAALTAVGPGKVDGNGLRKGTLTFTVPGNQTVV
jgi:hypothetical protein